MDEGFFSGKGPDPENTAPILLWLLRAIKLMPEGDARDWTKIGSWAQAVFA